MKLGEVHNAAAAANGRPLDEIMDRLLDLGEQRIRHMDETGIDKAIPVLPDIISFWE